MIKNNKKWDKGYTFMSSENIFKNIVKILKDCKNIKRFIKIEII